VLLIIHFTRPFLATPNFQSWLRLFRRRTTDI